MLNTLQEAAENFCSHQIGTTCKTRETPADKKVFIAYIDIQTNSGSKNRVYIASDTDFIQRVSKLFLEEEESDEETLKDMTLETANLIVGSAKVIAEQLELPYTIGTPHFEKFDQFNFDYDEIKVICIDNDELIIAVKELNA